MSKLEGKKAVEELQKIANMFKTTYYCKECQRQVYHAFRIDGYFLCATCLFDNHHVGQNTKEKESIS